MISAAQSWSISKVRCNQRTHQLGFPLSVIEMDTSAVYTPWSEAYSHIWSGSWLAWNIAYGINTVELMPWLNVPLKSLQPYLMKLLKNGCVICSFYESKIKSGQFIELKVSIFELWTVKVCPIIYTEQFSPHRKNRLPLLLLIAILFQCINMNSVDSVESCSRSLMHR